jgi:heat shock protein HtpX
MNALRTVFLLTLLTMVLVWLGNHFGGRSGMIIALGIGLALNFVNYWFSSSIVLKMYGAKILPPGEGGDLERDIREMTERVGMPMPKLAIIPNPAPNAFATGRNPQHAVVAVTEGLLRVCDRRQIRAVLAHELGHVRNRDMLTMTLVSGAVSAVSMLGHFAGFFGGRARTASGRHRHALVALWSRRWSRRWCRWPSAARGRPGPQTWARASPATPAPWPTRSRACTAPSRTRRR